MTESVPVPTAFANLHLVRNDWINPLDHEIEGVTFQSMTNTTPSPFKGKLGDLVPRHALIEDKYGASGFSCAVYKPGCTRGEAGVDCVTALVVDVDEITAENWAKVRQKLTGKCALFASTHSHLSTEKKGLQCWRVILPLSRPVNSIEFRALWDKMQKKLLLGHADGSTRGDSARFFFVPSAPKERWDKREYFWQDGRLLNPDRLIVVSGNRNTALYQIGCGLRRGGMEEEAIFAELWEMNLEAIDSTDGSSIPLEEREVRTIAHSCAQKEKGEGASFVVPDGRSLATSPQIEVPLSERGRPVYSPQTLALILRKDADFKRQLKLNRLTSKTEWHGAPMGDLDYVAIRNHVCTKYGFTRVGKDEVVDQVDLVARDNSYDPLQDYLTGLVWDGVPRLAGAASRYFGADPGPGGDLERAHVRYWLIGAVKRAMEPGCKMDYALVLQGGQGRMKSTSLAVLAGSVGGAALFADSALDLKNKDAYQGIATKWIWEWSELETKFKRSDRSEIKAFLSSQTDTFRPAYGRKPVDVQRRCVIVATTNEQEFLYDDTGNRRFWIVRVVGTIDLLGLRNDRDQIWAEAMVAWKGKERYWPTDEEHTLNEVHASQFMEMNPYHEVVTQAVEEQFTRANWDGWLDMRSVYERVGQNWTNADTRTRRLINGVLKDLGFVQKVRRVGNKTTKGMFRTIP